MFPLVIKAQRNAAKMTNNMPQLQVLQQKMTDARQAGNAMEGMLFTTHVPSFFSLYLEFSNYFCVVLKLHGWVMRFKVL
jgi:hypothetical protein